MIKASELRIGNYIIDTSDEILPVTQIKKDQVKVKGYKDFVFEEDCEGIHLTPEILEKCGFEIEGLQCSYTNNKVDLTEYVDGFKFSYQGVAFGVSINFLHQLQNLYFALTGEELTFNYESVSTLSPSQKT